MQRGTKWLSLSLVCVVVAASAGWIEEYKSGIIWPEPKFIDAGDATHAPADAIVLFDGKDLSQWSGGEQWIIENGVATAAKGGLTSKQKFGDCQLHLEFASPETVKGSGQGRGNSGVYLMGKYEIQILDSYQNPTYFDGQCASVYKQQPPMVNACRKPGEWQTYDIIFTAPRFEENGKVKTPGYVTVLHNGLVVHNHFELQGGTSYIAAPKYEKHPAKDSLNLQFHGDPVKFRNIWIRENIHPLIGKPPSEKVEPKKPEGK